MCWILQCVKLMCNTQTCFLSLCIRIYTHTYTHTYDCISSQYTFTIFVLILARLKKSTKTLLNTLSWSMLWIRWAFLLNLHGMHLLDSLYYICMLIYQVDWQWLTQISYGRTETNVSQFYCWVLWIIEIFFSIE